MNTNNEKLPNTLVSSSVKLRNESKFIVTDFKEKIPVLIRTGHGSIIEPEMKGMWIEEKGIINDEFGHVYSRHISSMLVGYN